MLFGGSESVGLSADLSRQLSSPKPPRVLLIDTGNGGGIFGQLSSLLGWFLPPYPNHAIDSPGLVGSGSARARLNSGDTCCCWYRCLLAALGLMWGCFLAENVQSSLQKGVFEPSPLFSLITALSAHSPCRRSMCNVRTKLWKKK